ncbi:MAG TPA: CHAD domain-containing protein [Ktedonobacteraceae bacterium]|jgi:CHAD domain-containing protein|nr:CHAD domain-containing protein [Ktedonobacteraceae bacterium]HZU66256.1 CHAD domain-containing protein [Ktedonobacteraceae bacterium]
MAKARPLKGLNPSAPTGQNARIIAKVRLEELYNWQKCVDDPYSVRELHNLRIAAKRLRYTFEVFEEFFPEASHPIVDELQQLQDELGELHDSDVMIAMLRLCLGSQDAGTISDTAKQKEKPLVQPELVNDLLDPAVAPTSEERYGLESLLHKQEQLREEQYAAFRKHWYELQARDFRREILDVLKS